MRKLLFSLLVLAGNTQAGQVKIQCPARFPMNNIELKDLPRNWNGGATVRKASLLLGAGFYNGPENGNAEMVGGGVVKTKDGHEVSYVAHPGPKRLVCAYGGGVELWHRLPEAVRACVVKTSTRRTRQHDPDIRIVCN
jgi:hypothetical protein